MTAPLHPLPDAAGAYFASDPAYLADHADWLRQRYEAHVSDALECHRRSKRHFRHGYRDLAFDNIRNGLRHFRMARHWKGKLS